MDVEEIFEMYGDMLYRVSLTMLKNRYDAEDAVQDTMIKYMSCRKEFADGEHIKAWLLRVNINLCKNRLRFDRMHPFVPLKELPAACESAEERMLLEGLLKLPAAYKEVLLLHYMEGYKIREIAQILKISENTVKKRLERGRNKLNKLLGGEAHE